jgi:hypothetical protein
VSPLGDQYWNFVPVLVSSSSTWYPHATPTPCVAEDPDGPKVILLLVDVQPVTKQWYGPPGAWRLRKGEAEVAVARERSARERCMVRCIKRKVVFKGNLVW